MYFNFHSVRARLLLVLSYQVAYFVNESQIVRLLARKKFFLVNNFCQKLDGYALTYRFIVQSFNKM